MKKILKFLGITAFAVGLSNSAFAMNCGSHGSGHQSSNAASDGQMTKVIINAGNKVCPVTGESIKEESMVTSEYDGKIYNFCCAACIGEFKKDPTEYIKKVEEEIKSTSKNER